MSKKKIWITIISCLLLAGIVYATSIYQNVSTTLETIHEPKIRKVSELRETKVELVEKEPISILLLGVDERDGDIGRSDTIIVITTNPSLASVKVLSIPRDTYTEIIGLDKKDKLNHAYAFGGIDMALHSVENLLDIPIDYVVQVNMDSFLKIVDSVGGVTVENPSAFTENGYQFAAGPIHLDGDSALSYVRMRKNDPLGDFGRQERQKQVLLGILKEGASFNSLLNYKELLASLSDNIRTNMTFGQMMDIQKGYKTSLTNVESITLTNGSGQRMDGIWYYVPNDEEMSDVTWTLKEHLELLNNQRE
ncbi:transcriptional attenuator, LytR family [Psychrobacillus psychrotolerans]|uniref:Transcriptional attenuator, LytR family n=1 Tax=Psychrobacillus psychrotolerans TaxID=126156 RepID=A0A1I5Z940_9BACI|nr:LCP family protein [Psychrobacillus psychrotolerans]SFQ53006.1 transcriptional attenuator, LytR family [Psychrobacillus psychrotolerans]